MEDLEISFDQTQGARAPGTGSPKKNAVANAIP